MNKKKCYCAFYVIIFLNRMTIEQNVNNDANYLHMDIYEFQKDLIRGRYNWIVKFIEKEKQKCPPTI